MFNKINSKMFTSEQINYIQDLIKDLYNLGFENEKDRKNQILQGRFKNGLKCPKWFIYVSSYRRTLYNKKYDKK